MESRRSESAPLSQVEVGLGIAMLGLTIFLVDTESVGFAARTELSGE